MDEITNHYINIIEMTGRLTIWSSDVYEIPVGDVEGVVMLPSAMMVFRSLETKNKKFRAFGSLKEPAHIRFELK